MGQSFWNLWQTGTYGAQSRIKVPISCRLQWFCVFWPHLAFIWAHRGKTFPKLPFRSFCNTVLNILWANDSKHHWCSSALCPAGVAVFTKTVWEGWVMERVKFMVVNTWVRMNVSAKVKAASCVKKTTCVHLKLFYIYTIKKQVIF